MTERLRQAQSRFGTERNRGGGGGVVQRMIANGLRKPMQVRPRRLNFAHCLADDDGYR
jgi:hypothetical protein